MPAPTLPASIAVRRAILAQLDRLAAARARLTATPESADALHDLRVAVRRTRALLRDGRAVLPRHIRRALTTPLRRIGRPSGAVRDLDVAVAACRSLAATAGDGATQAAAALIGDTLQAERHDRTGPLVRVLARSAPALTRARERLSVVTRSLDLDDVTVEEALRALVARRWRRHAAHLARLAVPDGAALHALRIRLKRVRALLVALEDRGAAVPSVAPVAALATAWQDRLGDARDLAVRAESAAVLARTGPASDGIRDALHLLATTWAAEAEGAQASARGAWLDGGRVTLVEALEQGATALVAAGRGPAVAAVPSPDGALPREIERKYLLRALPPAVLDAPWVHIAQGYLPGEALIERVRRTTQPDGAVACVRTVKLGRGVERVEIEEGISPSLFDGLWALTAPHRVSKRRYRIADAEGAWEVDDFEGLDLVLAERELPAVETPVPIPDWMAPYLVREVTDEAAYTNVQLARRAGLPRQPVGARV